LEIHGVDENPTAWAGMRLLKRFFYQTTKSDWSSEFVQKYRYYISEKYFKT